MAGTTDTTSADTPRGNGIAEAADAFQALISPGATPDKDDEDDEAQQDEKPTGNAAQADDDEGSKETEDDDEAGDDDRGDKSEEGDSEEEESESEEGEETEAEAQDDQLYTVTVDGKEEQVTLEELAKGYSRTKDYTRKTQAVADERRQVQAERQEIGALRSQYAQGLEQLQAALQQVSPQEPDWDTLRATDPIEFAAQWADHQRRQAVLQQIDHERNAVIRQQEHERQVAQEEAIKEGRKWLLEQVPEWTDPAKAKADREGMQAFAMKLGFTAEELKGANDPRAILLIRQAWQYAKLQEKKATLIKPVKKPATPTKTPVLKPGSVTGSTKSTSDLTRAKQRLAKTGSVRDAADVFSRMIGG